MVQVKFLQTKHRQFCGITYPRGKMNQKKYDSIVILLILYSVLYHIVSSKFASTLLNKISRSSAWPSDSPGREYSLPSLMHVVLHVYEDSRLQPMVVVGGGGGPYLGLPHWLCMWPLVRTHHPSPRMTGKEDR